MWRRQSWASCPVCAGLMCSCKGSTVCLQHTSGAHYFAWELQSSQNHPFPFFCAYLLSLTVEEDGYCYSWNLFWGIEIRLLQIPSSTSSPTLPRTVVFLVFVLFLTFRVLLSFLRLRLLLILPWLPLLTPIRLLEAGVGLTATASNRACPHSTGDRARSATAQRRFAPLST